MSRFLIVSVFTLLLFPFAGHAQSKEATDSVFVDEGDGDFEDIPADVKASNAPVAPTQAPQQATTQALPSKTAKASKKSAAPAAQVENWEDGDTSAPPKAKDAYDQMADTAVMPADTTENVNIPHHKKSKKGPRPASLAGVDKDFKSYGFKTTAHSCAMRSEPREDAEQILEVKENRRLWLQKPATSGSKVITTMARVLSARIVFKVSS